jgi:hypothetical protein
MSPAGEWRRGAGGDDPWQSGDPWRSVPSGGEYIVPAMPSPWPARAALGLLAVYLLLAIPPALGSTARGLRAAARTAGLSAAEVRARVFGRRYTAAVERIRLAIPVDEAYLLTEQREPGAMLWVRFDLLPRRAVVVQPQTRPGDCWLEQVRWTVVGVGLGRPPLLLERRPVVPPGCPPAPWRTPGRMPAR